MTKIDDEMVERAYEKHPHYLTWKGDKVSQGYAKATIREMLEAALSPKPEPEIEDDRPELGRNRDTWPAETLLWLILCELRNFRAQEGAAYAAAPVKETGGGVGGVYRNHHRFDDKPGPFCLTVNRWHRRSTDK